MGNSVLVVLSGGQDSTTCLYWAIDKFGSDAVETVTFDYGQRHRIELECAEKIASKAGVRNALLPIDTFGALGGSAQHLESPHDPLLRARTLPGARN